MRSLGGKNDQSIEAGGVRGVGTGKPRDWLEVAVKQDAGSRLQRQGEPSTGTVGYW